MKGRIAGKGRSRQMKRLYICWFTYQGAGQAEARSLKLYQELPHGWQGLKYLGHAPQALLQ